MKNRQIIASVFMLLFLIVFARAEVLCSKNIISNSDNSVTCTNYNNLSSSINKYGSLFTISNSFIDANSSINLVVTIDNSAPNGNLGLITFSNSATQIQVNNNKTSPVNQCNINPSLISYSQNIQQGTKTLLPKITFDPIDCSGNLVLTASNVYVLGGITTQNGQKPLYLQSVVSDGVILGIDTTDLTSQTYSSILYINAFSKTFQIPFNVIVTTGTSVSNNFSLANLPTCSLTNNILNINSSYSLVCSNIAPDITITPEVDEDYIIGTGLDSTNTQFIWYFKPQKYGNTIIKAKFNYRGVPVGSQFSQEVKIQSQGISLGGTNLAFLFTPRLDQAKNGDNVVIQLVDNSSGSLINGGRIFVDANLLNSTDGYTFKMPFLIDHNYSLRGVANGYSDIIMTAYLMSKPMVLTINPESGDTSTTFTIKTDVNSSLFLDGNSISNPFTGSLSLGNHTINAIAQGYFSVQKDIYVENSITLSGEFKKGILNILTLNKNATWNVVYKEDAISQGTNILSGNGSIIEVKPDKFGIYEIISEGKVLATYQFKSNGFRILGISFWWWLVGLAVIIGIYVLYKKNQSFSPISIGGGGLGGNVNI